jgi:hypothetical protein
MLRCPALDTQRLVRACLMSGLTFSVTLATSLSSAHLLGVGLGHL